MQRTQLHAPRQGARLVLVGLTATALAACGGLTPGSSNTSGSATSAGPVTTAVPTGKVTLTMAFTDLPDMVKQLVAAYNKKHPNVTIKTQYTQFNDYVKNIKLTMSSDSPPDIAQFNSGSMQSIITAGLLKPLDGYAKAYSWKKSMPPVSLQQLTTDKTGKVYGTGSLYAVPGGLSLVGVYYNKKLAKQAGITVPPKTVAEFAKDLGKAKKAGQTPLLVGALDNGALHLWAELTNVEMSLASYRKWVYGQPGGNIATSGAKKAAQLVQEWATKGYIPKSANGTSENDSAANFEQGKSTFMVNGNWSAGDIDKNMGSNAGFFYMPPTSSGGKATGSGYSVCYSVSAKTKHPAAAASFLNFLTSPEAAKIVAKNGLLPVNAKEAPTQTGVLGDVLKSFQKVAADNGIQQFPDASAPQMLDTLQSGLQKVIAGRQTPDEFVQSLQKVWDSYRAK